MKGYTPGPWEVAEKHPGSVIAKHAQRVIAYCTRPEDEGHENETEKANAALIARAPEMAEEVERLRGALERVERRLSATAHAFYVVGKPSALREAFAGWKEDAEAARAALAKP